MRDGLVFIPPKSCRSFLAEPFLPTPGVPMCWTRPCSYKALIGSARATFPRDASRRPH